MRIKRLLAAVSLCWVAVSVGYSQSAGQYLVALPQIAFGGGWETKIVVTNVSTSAQTVVLNYYDTNGNPLMIPFNAVPASQTTLTIPVGGQQEVVPDFQSNTTVVGWAGISYNALGVRIQGVFLWQNGGNSTQAVAPIVSLVQPCILPFPGSVPITMPFDMTGGGLTAFAFANTNSTPVTMTLTFFDQSGNNLGTYTPAAIPGYGHTQFALNAAGLPAGLGNAKGSMQISGAGVVPLGFKFYGSIFTTWLP
jgi:hypothetical protein